jgi:polyprenyldihydroxybenzoate methyltransferase/3-demethylubiquinol 3-O-methyltransferase
VSTHQVDLKVIGDVKFIFSAQTDAGCGGGVLTEAIGRAKGKVVGLDCAKQLIALAEDHMAPQDDLKPYVTYVCETIEEHCVKYPNRYDAVVASEVLEHIDDKAAFLDCCVKAVKPGGSIFITTISKTFMGWFIAKLWAEYITGIIRRGSHEFKLFITHKNVSRMLKEFDCRTERVRGVRYDFFRARKNKFQFSRYTGVAYTLQAVKEK